MSDKAKIWGSTLAAAAAIVGALFAVEGGFVNDPKDPGGATNHGITEKVARDHGYQGSMEQLPKEVAVDIYSQDYINEPGFNRVIAISPAVGHKLVDAGVNAGAGRASRWFQEALNQLNRGGQDYPMLTVDGQLGPRTLAAYQALERKRGRAKACEMVLKLVDVQQGAHYMRLGMPTFVVGWVDHRLGNVPLARCAETVAGGGQ
ncbi:glycoside hydrolase family 108 protein [Comamonas sp. B21-038]|uniref:glycoside hydrolase family 108 protein n=1 Tax=Comamonas sp. B21-038 TaxID=2918299 RepID=UPI001EFA68A9|nr:glycosyl hydrolase 108 family protein [Comamonas sp. B21-038]ULR90931.1 hypothetical protein MJ205_08830 [Comamonas sp. B21-038]